MIKDSKESPKCPVCNKSLIVVKCFKVDTDWLQDEKFYRCEDGCYKDYDDKACDRDWETLDYN